MRRSFEPRIESLEERVVPATAVEYGLIAKTISVAIIQQITDVKKVFDIGQPAAAKAAAEAARMAEPMDKTAVKVLTPVGVSDPSKVVEIKALATPALPPLNAAIARLTAQIKREVTAIKVRLEAVQERLLNLRQRVLDLRERLATLRGGDAAATPSTVMAQSGIAALAQANQSSQNVLALLR
ncbi:MAG: hypothetical protein AB7K24_08550 [Gemmataceae bacterium]